MQSPRTEALKKLDFPRPRLFSTNRPPSFARKLVVSYQLDALMSSGPTLSKAERSKVKTRNPNGEPQMSFFQRPGKDFTKRKLYGYTF